MAHEINTRDNVLVHTKQAWHRLGLVVDEDMTALEAAERCGLLWGVQGWDLRAFSPAANAAWESLSDAIELRDMDAAAAVWTRLQAGLEAVPSHKANVRVEKDYRGLLGVVGSDYATCQNRELAEFTDALADSGKVVIESCGSIRDGKRVWFLARGEAFDVAAEDTVYPYLLVSNGHDGGSSIRVTPTTVRVVCSNTLHMVIPASEEAGRLDRAAIVIRHTGSISDKLTAAKEALRHYGNTLERNRELFSKLAEIKIDREQALSLFAGQYASSWRVAVEDDFKNVETRRVAELRNKRMDEAASQFLARYDSECKKFGGQSLWLAVNAWTGYTQHDRAVRGKSDAERLESRVDQNLFGLNADRAQAALQTAYSQHVAS